jgi:hypothetical protein
MGLHELLREINERSDRAAVTAPASPDQLRRALAKLEERHEFKVGDLVKWKEGLATGKYPAEGTPAIVVGFNVGNIDDETNAGSPYYLTPRDLVLGVIVEGTLLTYHNDARRFEPYTES